MDKCDYCGKIKETFFHSWYGKLCLGCYPKTYSVCFLAESKADGKLHWHTNWNRFQDESDINPDKAKANCLAYGVVFGPRSETIILTSLDQVRWVNHDLLGQHQGEWVNKLKGWKEENDDQG